VGDIARIAVKGWVNNQLRRTLSDKSCQDILVLFSVILGEAVDEGLIGTNPCRKLRITFTERAERPHATPDEVVIISARMPTDAGLLVITAAYTGLRWGELAGLQWTRTHLDDVCPRIDVDPSDGALHELGGRLELGPPKSAASARTVHLPPFLADLLTEHRDHHPDTPFVFTGANGGLHRRANFRQRFWQPALTGNPEHGMPPIQQEMHFHDLRHTHETWRPGAPRAAPATPRAQAQGHRRLLRPRHPRHAREDARRAAGTVGAQRRPAWLRSSTRGPTRREHFGPRGCSADPAPHLLPTRRRPADEDHQQAV